MVRQRTLAEEKEKREQDMEMEMALKMSMAADEPQIEEEQKPETDEAKLIEVPSIELDKFKERVLEVVPKLIESLTKGARSGTFNIKLETILALIRVSLIG